MPGHESSHGSTPSGIQNTVVELAQQHGDHQQVARRPSPITQDATAPRSNATTVALATPDLNRTSVALRMRALYGGLAALDGVLLHFAYGMEHHVDSNSSHVPLPAPFPPDYGAKSVSRLIFLAGILSTVVGLLMSSVLTVFSQSENAVVRLLGQRFAGAANRCRMTLCSGSNSLAKYLLAWLTVLPSACGFVLVMLVRFRGV